MMVTGLLLAGGEGRRMGGLDKGLVDFCGQPLVAHVLQRLRPQLDCIHISANRHLSDYQQYGYEVHVDDVAWLGMGPLAALATAHQYLPLDCDMVQLAACDMPFLPDNLVSSLAASGAGRAVMPVTVQGPQPACCLVPRSALASVAPYLLAGGRSIRGWLAGMAVMECRFDAEGFVNANDPDSLQLLSAGLAGSMCSSSN